MKYTDTLLRNNANGTKTSKLGMGAAAFGYMYNRQSGKQEAVDIIRRAFGLGINVFDTSPWYSFNDGCTEKPFGEALKDIDRSKFFMSTKIGRYGGPRPLDFSADRAEASLKRGLEYMNLEYVDMLQLHHSDTAQFDERAMNQIFSETLPAMDRLRKQGLVKHIGIASFDLDFLDMMLEKSPVKIDIALTWAKLCLHDTQVKERIASYKAKNLGVIACSPLGRGLLISNDDDVPSDKHFHPDLMTAAKEARKICKNNNLMIEELALAYTCDEAEQCGVDLVLSGPSSIAELEANVRVYESGMSKKQRDIAMQLRQGPFGSEIDGKRDSFSCKIDYEQFMKLDEEN